MTKVKKVPRVRLHGVRFTTAKDLANFREPPRGSHPDISYALWCDRKWITGMGEFTDAGELVLEQWDSLGKAATLPKSRRECLLSVMAGNGWHDRRHLEECESHRLLKGQELTDRGHMLLRLYFEHPEQEP